MKVLPLKRSDKTRQELAEEIRLKHYEEAVKNLARQSLPTLIETGSAEQAYSACLLEIQSLSEPRVFKAYLCELANTLPPGTQVKVGNRTMSIEDALVEILRQPFYRALIELKDELDL